jgi:hypothetical protein
MAADSDIRRNQRILFCREIPEFARIISPQVFDIRRAGVEGLGVLRDG